ncbi:MAG: YkgJ family cysteine cluster protein [Cyanobacteria bacterium P01_H01_bin.130]
MAANPFERYQAIRTTIVAIAQSADQLMESLEAEGQGPVAPEVVQMVAHTAVALTQGALEARSRAAAATEAEPQIACRSGCSWCCYLHVPMSQPEVQVILRYLQHRMSASERERLQQRIEATARRLQTVKSSDRLGRRVPCAFLDLRDNRCSIHPVRPAACRDHHSTEVMACENSFKAGQWSAPSHSRHDLVANTATMAIAEACTQRGRDGSFDELHAALVHALSPETMLDPWTVPDDLDEAELPTVILDSPDAASEPGIGRFSGRFDGATPVTSSGLNSSPVRELSQELLQELAQEALPASDGLEEWGDINSVPEESDNNSLFNRPFSGYFVDGSGDALSGGAWGSFSPPSQALKGGGIGGTPQQRLEESAGLDDASALAEGEMEGAIQEILLEISPVEASPSWGRTGLDAPRGLESDDDEQGRLEDGDDAGMGFWRG